MNENRLPTHELIGLDGTSASFRVYSKQQILEGIGSLEGVNLEEQLPFVNKQPDHASFILQKHSDGQVFPAVLI